MNKENNLIESLENLKEQFSTGELHWKSVLSAIEVLTNGYRSWETPFWKTRRDELLTNSCAQCGASEDETILVLQHMWHPAKLNELREIAYDAYKRANPFSQADADEADLAVKDSTIPKRNACPNCTSINLRYREKDEKWICNKCKSEFDKPVSIDDPKAIDEIKNKVWEPKGRQRYQNFLQDDNYQNVIINTFIDDQIRYLSFRDTVTFCKKCAFLWDERRMRLCPKCHVNYAKFEQGICHECEFDAVEGIYTLSLAKARNWIKTLENDALNKNDNQQKPMGIFEYLLIQNKLEVVEVSDEYLRVKATRPQVYETLSGQKSRF